MMFEYDRKAYAGGHVVPLCDFATVVTYLDRRVYRFLVEFYNDSGKQFAVKFSEHPYPTEQMALDAACDLVAYGDLRVGA